jgi:hypothetical protein
MPFSQASLLIYIPLGIVVFIVLREVLAWYWKINEVIFLLEEISSKLGPKSQSHDAGKSADEVKGIR